MTLQVLRRSLADQRTGLVLLLVLLLCVERLRPFSSRTLDESLVPNASMARALPERPKCGRSNRLLLCVADVVQTDGQPRELRVAPAATSTCG